MRPTRFVDRYLFPFLAWPQPFLIGQPFYTGTVSRHTGHMTRRNRNRRKGLKGTQP